MKRSQAALREAMDRSRILIVEDNPRNRTLLEGILKGAGFGNLHFAEDGLAGLEAVQHLRPDLVLLDLMMPRMDGEQMLRRLRADPLTSGVPVIVQTAADNAETRNQLFEAGATDFVGKPLNLREFVAKIRIHLQNRVLLQSLETHLARIEDELADAREMQAALLPSPARMDALVSRYGVTVEARFEPSSELGGDLWGCRELADGSLLFTLFDLSGHGVSAAINSFRFHTLIERSALLDSRDPGGWLAWLNEQLVELLPRGRFATMSALVLDVGARRVTFASAGAPGAIIGGNRDLRSMDGAGMPLGIRRGTTYANTTLTLDDKAFIFLYSDGLSETTAPGGGLVGEAGIAALAEAAGGHPHPLAAIFDALGLAVEGMPRDDRTAVWISL